MVPRRRLVPLLVVLCLLVAGCGGYYPGAGADQSPGMAVERSPPESPTTTPPPTTAVEGATPPPSPSDGPHTVAPEDRLVVDTATSEDVTVSLYEYRGDGRAPNSTTVDPENWERVESATYSGAGQIRVDDFEVDGHVVLSRNDTVLWEGTIAPYEHVELWIDAEGDVSISDHFVL